MSKVEEIHAVGKLFASDRVRLLTNNELMMLAFCDVLKEEATVTNLSHSMTLVLGKGVTFGQITTPLKQLGTMGLILASRVRAPSGRLVDAFTLTEPGETVLDAAKDIAENILLAKESKPKSKLEGEPKSLLSELAQAAEAVLKGRPNQGALELLEPDSNQTDVTETTTVSEPAPYSGQPTWDDHAPEDLTPTGDEDEEGPDVATLVEEPTDEETPTRTRRQSRYAPQRTRRRNVSK